MVNAVIAGTIGIDTVETPFGKAENVLGGSAAYAAYACSFFERPGIVSVIGKDFPQKHLELLSAKADISGIQRSDENSFRWHGKYGFDVNIAQTLKTEANVLEKFQPELPESYRHAEYLFLGNLSPKNQLSVLGQMKKRPKLVVSDTMNYYIEKDKKNVLKVVEEVDIALMNDSEARQLFQTPNLFAAAREILKLDSSYAIIKKGENGAIMFSKQGFFACPGYPLETIIDPTGCGDCFGGTLTGFFAETRKFTERNYRKAIVFSSAVSSFNAEDFSLNRLQKLSFEEIKARYNKFKDFVRF